MMRARKYNWAKNERVEWRIKTRVALSLFFIIIFSIIFSSSSSYSSSTHSHTCFNVYMYLLFAFQLVADLVIYWGSTIHPLLASHFQAQPPWESMYHCIDKDNPFCHATPKSTCIYTSFNNCLWPTERRCTLLTTLPNQLVRLVSMHSMRTKREIEKKMK